MNIEFSLGCNFDPALVDGVLALHDAYPTSSRRIGELYGALPESPIPSARPHDRIPAIGWQAFEDVVSRLRSSGIGFNYLMNTALRPTGLLAQQVRNFLHRLADIGVDRITAGTPELATLIKHAAPTMHVTLSISYGVRDLPDLCKARDAGADAVYLDGVFVNRNFALLRTLVAATALECRLYANMSCVSGCPVTKGHYGLFAKQDQDTAARNDAYFLGCTLVKAANPVEWLQMPWIRPEDIAVYVQEGIAHFKLADRLAPTSALLHIAHAYVSGKSPDDLFPLMERDGSKYRMLAFDGQPMCVANICITNDFIDHFRTGTCTSTDASCEVCTRIATKAITVHPRLQQAAQEIVTHAHHPSSTPPAQLIRRAKKHIA